MGKTVTMTAVANHFKKQAEWIVIDLNPSRDLLSAFGSRLYDALNKNKFELKAINPSAFGVSVLSMKKKMNLFLVLNCSMTSFCKQPYPKKKRY